MRTEIKHTPGPWRVVPIGPEAYIGWNGNGFLADMRRNEAENEAEVAKCDANARLIAAAPDLLEACKLAMEVVSECDPDTVRMYGQILKAAIAKAERRESPESSSLVGK